MTKAKRQMQEDIRLVDLLIEMLDARVPSSSRNPDINELGKGKYRLVLLNKADLSDERKNRQWTQYFEKQGIQALLLDARTRNQIKDITAAIREICAEKSERDRRRGILNRPVRAMVAGIPNVGKSTLINSFAGRAVTKTGNKPGVTKGKQWIRLNKEVELLDTPGILWPKFDDPMAGERLSMIGSIRDEILNLEEPALSLLDYLRQEYPKALATRYGIDEDGQTVTILSRIAVSRGCFRKGEELDYGKAARLLLDDFRQGKLGRITLEYPETDKTD